MIEWRVSYTTHRQDGPIKRPLRQHTVVLSEADFAGAKIEPLVYLNGLAFQYGSFNTEVVIETRETGEWHPVGDEPEKASHPSLAELLDQYLARRELERPVTTTCDKIVEEATELRDAWQARGRNLAAVRAEIADVVLAAAVVAGDIGTTVEACIAEKTRQDEGRRLGPHTMEPITEGVVIQAEPKRDGLMIEGNWLVQEVDGCTCGGGGVYPHEPGCGTEPLVDLSMLPGYALMSKHCDECEAGDQAEQSVRDVLANVQPDGVTADLLEDEDGAPYPPEVQDLAANLARSVREHRARWVRDDQQTW